MTYRDDLDDEDDAEDDADDDTVPCPYCGEQIYEDAVRCPECGQYLSYEERTSTMQPQWIVATAVVLLAILVYAYLR